MNLILILIAEVFIASLTKNIIPYDIMEFILIIVNIFLIGIYISTKIDNKNTLIIIYFGYLVRILLMFSDIYISTLPFSGADTWSFHKTAVTTANMLPITLPNTPFGVYAQFLGILYYLFGGPVKMFGQHINIIIFIISTIKIVEILKVYNIENKYINISMLLYIWFMPVSLFQSAILLREMFIVFFMTLSICSLLMYLKNNNVLNILISYIYVFLAASFHSGVVFCIIPYTFIISMYNIEHKHYSVTFKSIIFLIIVILLIILGFNMFGENFIHLKDISNIDSILEKVNNSSQYAKLAGSGYLKELKVVGALGLILLTPLKVIYFLFSPMPWQLRGGMDAITFLLDSMIYIIAIYGYIRIKKEKYKIPNEIYDVVRMLYNIYLFMIIPYAWGTIAAGTAIRHRFKGFFIILIAYTIYKYYLDKYNEKNEIVRS